MFDLSLPVDAMPVEAMAAAALVGLLGGGHCVAMCGGIVASLAGGASQPALAAGYQIGRIGSYALAGAVAGALGSVLLLADRWLPVQRAMYLVAAVLVILLGVYLTGFTRVLAPLEHLGGSLWRALSKHVSRFVPARNLRDAMGLGALWGWVPCGLVYSVLVTAAASGSAARGALVMLAFGAGTVPLMFAASTMAHRVARLRSDRRVRVASGVVVVAMGAWGLVHAMHGQPVLELIAAACGLRG